METNDQNNDEQNEETKKEINKSKTRIKQHKKKSKSKSNSSNSDSENQAKKTLQKVSSNKDLILNNYVLISEIGHGAFGQIYLSFNMRDNIEVAVKKEKKNPPKIPQLKTECKIYQTLLNIPTTTDVSGNICLKQDDVQGVPKFYGMGDLVDEYYLIMEFLGPNLIELLNYCGTTKFTIGCVCLLALQMITRLETLHKANYIHRDIKPENFMIGTENKSSIVYLIDFGLSKRYKNAKNLQHIPYREGRPLVGTARYVSINTHLGIEQSRRDDLESLSYALIFFLKGNLPWQGLKGGMNKYNKIMEKKLQIPTEILCFGLPDEISIFLNYCKGLRFEDRPDYDYCRGLFVKLLGHCAERYGIVKEYFKFDWCFEDVGVIWGFYKDKKKKEIEKSKEKDKENKDNMQNELINNNENDNNNNFQVSAKFGCASEDGSNNNQVNNVNNVNSNNELKVNSVGGCEELSNENNKNVQITEAIEEQEKEESGNNENENDNNNNNNNSNNNNVQQNDNKEKDKEASNHISSNIKNSSDINKSKKNNKEDDDDSSCSTVKCEFDGQVQDFTDNNNNQDVSPTPNSNNINNSNNEEIDKYIDSLLLQSKNKNKNLSIQDLIQTSNQSKSKNSNNNNNKNNKNKNKNVLESKIKTINLLMQSEIDSPTNNRHGHNNNSHRSLKKDDPMLNINSNYEDDDYYQRIHSFKKELYSNYNQDQQFVQEDVNMVLAKENLIKIKKESYIKYYEVISDIGEGSYGKVKKVRHLQLNEVRAMKIVSKGKNLTSSANEIECLRKLSHPNIVNVFEIFEDQHQYYIISEFCDGGELFDAITNQGFYSEADAAKIMKQILQAVNYLHNSGIVHRDLKPENIMLLAEQSNLKLIDFGTVVQRPRYGKKLRKFIGTSYYIAPEVIQECYDEKCDVWSCGVILYILLCGYPPFNGMTNHEIYNAIQYNSPIFNNEEWQDVSKEAINLISQMLDKNPRTRLSAEKCLNHKWFNQFNNVSSQEITKLKQNKIQIATKMAKFVKQNKFKQAILQFISTEFNLKKEEEELKNIFKEFDKENKGTITREAFISQIEKFQRGINRNIICDIFSKLDLDGSGTISYNEFLTSIIDNKKILTEDRLVKAFNLLDKNGNGLLSLGEIKSYFGGEEETWKKVLKEVDKNGDGEVDFNEFKALMIGFDPKDIVGEMTIGKNKN